MSNGFRMLFVVCAAFFGGVLAVCLRDGDADYVVVFPAVGVTLFALGALVPWKDASPKGEAVSPDRLGASTRCNH